MVAVVVADLQSAHIADDWFSSAEVAQFHRDGFVIVRGLADVDLCDEMLQATQEGLSREIGPVEYEADLKYPGAPASWDASGGRTIRRLKMAHARHPVFTRWLNEPGLLARMRQLLGPDLVVPLAHHNCVMTKQPRHSSETGWHQDIRYWSFARPELVSAWLALGRERAENGCLQVIPGTHLESFAPWRLDDNLFLRTDLPENQELIDGSFCVELGPGDVLFFHCRTTHSAGRNVSDEPKFSAVFTFRSADNLPLRETRSSSLPELLVPSN